MNSKWTAAIVFLLGLVLLDQGLAWVLDRGVRAGLGRDVVRRVQHATTALDTDIIITGSSRAVNHLDPSVLERELGAKTLSVGCLGQGQPYSRMVQAILLDSGVRPELFVLQVNTIDLYNLNIDEARILLPFIHRSRGARDVLMRAGWQEHLKLLCGTYRYNSQLVGMLRQWWRPAPLGDGFDPVPARAAHHVGDHPNKGIPQVGMKYDPVTREIIHEFVNAARAAGSDVVMIAGPHYWGEVEPTDIYRDGLDRLEAIADELGVLFLRHTHETDPVFDDPGLFTNPSHLNLRGADILSHMLADDLRPILEARAAQ